MNPGYLSFLSYWFVFIFIWIGLLSPFLNQIQIKKRYFYLIFLVSWIGTFFNIPIYEKLQINVGGYAVPFLLAMWIWTRENEQHRAHLFSVGALIGASVLLVRGMIRLDPVIMIVDEMYMVAILTGFLSLIAVRRYIHHVFVITMGLFVEQILYTWYFWDKLNVVVLGNAAFRDTWWMSLWLAGTGQLLLSGIKVSNPIRKIRLSNKKTE
ncbi:MAG: hypothetical protein H0Z33_02180 [Bacillaceae bacterium]|nr:hypothetical protein [Bacillaceae bacterium]